MVCRVLMLALVLAAAATAACSPLGTGDATDPPELGDRATDWPAPNHDLAATRAAEHSEIDRESVARLRVRWRFRLRGEPAFSGLVASTPLVVGDTVYVQDLHSDVFAVDRETGAVRWVRRYRQENDGPNGLAVGYGKVFGNSATATFALDADTGREVWRRRLVRPNEDTIGIAPTVANGLVYTSTLGWAPGGKGALYALDAQTGAVRWRFVTIKGDWAVPSEAGGGGAWFPPSVDEDGRVYVGNSNPDPWGGTPELPNGAAFRGPALYTDSLLVLDGRAGRLLWHDQVTPHDVRDYDFQVSPILARVRGREVVFGAGKAGRVLAWDRRSRKRLWTAVVGRHRNDRGPLPRRPVTICPGLLGGVETPMAYRNGRLYVPVVDLCVRGSATGYENLFAIDYEARGTGLLVALDAANGKRIWTRRFESPLFACATLARDVVFTATYDGRLYALDSDDGAELWSRRLRAGINACPAVAGDLLVVGAGVDHPAFENPIRELVAYSLR